METVKQMKQDNPFQTAVAVKNVNKHYGHFHVLKNVSLSVAQGEKLVIIGPSGSGKSTLLKIFNLLVEPDLGTYLFENEEKSFNSISKKEALSITRKTGMVFQNFGLFQHLTALQNIALPLIKVHGYSKEEANRVAAERLVEVGLFDKMESFPSQLSGGQQQRIGIARAIAPKPKLILFDEPTSALDPERVGEVLSTIKRIGDNGQTMIVVTHELGFARSIADRIVFMDEGQIIAEGTPEYMFSNDAPERVRAFMGNMLTYTI